MGRAGWCVRGAARLIFQIGKHQEAQDVAAARWVVLVPTACLTCNSTFAPTAQLPSAATDASSSKSCRPEKLANSGPFTIEMCRRSVVHPRGASQLNAFEDRTMARPSHPGKPTTPIAQAHLQILVFSWSLPQLPTDRPPPLPCVQPRQATACANVGRLFNKVLCTWVGTRTFFLSNTVE